MDQRDLWDALPETEDEAKARDRQDRDQARRQAIRRLRAGGHWLTLLRVARTIPQPFTLNDISVAVWRACPDFFGMKGYPYPDNHKVHYIASWQRCQTCPCMSNRPSPFGLRIPTGCIVRSAIT